ncbi:hypothetical protein Ocin01_07137 [Orchesella cincta]|uniref:Uncharacterized protein n=1 Tax=Orchesella cincta TaxID=48709 RepID=A0A1D2N2T5_ORCCI|nr:hypothetical protein Ocin01_07137 [Orchesella cincta]
MVGIYKYLAIFAFATVVVTQVESELRSPNYSVCSDFFVGKCENGLASDAMFFDLQITGVSVIGLHIFMAQGRNGEPTGLAEFVFQENFGQYYQLTETAGLVTSLKRLGALDYKTPAISFAYELELITDGVAKFEDSAGSIERCSVAPATKSLVVHGVESWELVLNNGTSICLQVENTNSFVPGIVKDIENIGLPRDPFANICYVVKGCTLPPQQIIRIPNNVTSGVLRR